MFSAAEAVTYSDTINWMEDGQAAYLACSSSSSLVCQYHTATRDGSFTKSLSLLGSPMGVRFQWRYSGPTNVVCVRGNNPSGPIILCWDTGYDISTQTLVGNTGYQNMIDEDHEAKGSVFNAGDIILNQYDNCDYVINVDQLDSDSDLQGNACDTDDDNDGVLDTSDAFSLNPTEWLDTDSDTIGNNADWDDDADAVPDLVDASPLDGGDVSEVVLPLDAGYKGGFLQESAVKN